MTGRLKVLLGGIIIGLAIPFDVWEWLREMARDPEFSEFVFMGIALGFVVFVSVVVYRNINKE